MIKTAATAVIQGVTYKLTPLTIAVEKRKQEITALEGKYNAGAITYQVRPCPIPAYITCNPYAYQYQGCGNSCGCGC